MPNRNAGWCISFLSLLVMSFCACAETDPALKFIENKNQWPTAVDFGVRVPGGQLYIQAGMFRYSFIDTRKLETLHERSHTGYNEADEMDDADHIKGHNIQVNFLNANTAAKAQSFGKSDTYYNYFIGDSSQWASGAHAFDGVLYQDLYNGIDLKVYSSNVNLKYDYIVAPYADPAQITVAYSGAEKIYLDNGNLYVYTSLSEMIEKRPYAYQYIGGNKITVACDYVLNDNRLSFHFPKGYDACYELVIDPLLIFSTYSGSTADNWGSTATPGEHGNLYSAGVTEEVVFKGKFPATPGSFQTTYGGLYDVGILKYDSLGKKLLYATYLGGINSESPHSLVINAQNDLVVLGTTSSFNFPTTSGVIDRSFNDGTNVSHVVHYSNGSDIFVARISADGKNLLASTFLGGVENDGLNVLHSGLVRNYGDELRGDIICDADGNIYISSVTSSPDFPLTKGVDTVYNGGDTDAILLKLNASLTKMIWGTYLGGANTDAAHTLKLDHERNIFIAGGSNSVNFPTTVGSYQKLLARGEDGWIAKVKNDGTSILSSTFTGTAGYDQVYFLDLNEDEEVYVYGQTDGQFPISSGVYSNPGSGQFVQKFNHLLTTSIFSTVFGSRRGFPDISPTAFLVNECNNLYMTGWGGIVNSREGFWNSDTRNMPISPDAFQKTTSGSDFYFISLTDDASKFLYGTYLGGTQSRTHVDGGTSRFDKSGIVYHAVCSGCAAFNATENPTSDFPTTPGAFSRLNRSQNCNNAAFKFDLSILKAGLQTNSIALNMPGFNKVCIPDKIVFQNRCIGGETFEWDFGDGNVLTADDTTMIAHQYKTPGRYTVKLKAIDVGTCIGKDSVFTVVDVFEAHSNVQEDDTLCEGVSYMLKATGGASYDWKTIDDSFRSFNSSPVVAPTDTTQYFVTITEASGCVRQDTVQINVIPTLELDFEMKRQADCFTRPTVKMKNLTKNQWPTDNIVFDFGDNETSDADEIIHNYEKDGVYKIRMIGNREFCGAEKIIDVPIFLARVPNAITPLLKDGKNDTFIVEYGEGGIPSNHNLKVSLVVYNRWSRVVYESDNYTNDWAGEGLAAGIYYFDVTIEGHATCKGWVQVVR